ncbi:hypothetical protein C8R48DRAFT_767365 [Suillus tomentosus]|nr:hypothetical protein C8R48DRAFT_767365 [Suillus tomentosus]
MDYATVFRTRSLVQVVSQYLDRLPDLLAWTHANQEMHDVGCNVAAKRFSDIMAPFVGGHGAEMRHLLHITTSLITGSCAMKMLTGDDTSPNNLNLITPFESADVLYAYIVSDLRYERVQSDAVPHRAFIDSVHSFVKFRKGAYCITVTEATADGVFRVVTSSPTTADMIVMTPGGVAIFYPDWTLGRITVANHRVTRGIAEGLGQEIGCPSVGCSTKSCFRLERTTDFLGEPCGTRCPSLWRNVAEEGGQMLVLEWDDRFSIKAVVDRSQTMWRLALYCQNKLCCYNPNNTACTAPLPAMPAPGDMARIKLEEAQISKHWPHYQGSVQGLLYATSARNPIVVSVPFRDGIKKVGSISHLQVMHWVNQLGPDLFISSTGRFRKTYNLIAEMPGGAIAVGYTFFREHAAVFPAPNRLIRGIASITSNADDVTGNVLVVKHCQGKKDKVMDCNDEDIPWVNGILKQ